MTGLLEKTYSKALFELAVEENVLDEIFNELKMLAQIFYENDELEKCLSVPTITGEEKSSIISNIFSGKVSDLTYNFLNVLVEKGRIVYIQKIYNQFRNMYNEKNGILEVTAITTKPLSDELKKKLIQKLESISLKKINLIENVDEAILGGIVLSYGNTQLDASIKSKIDSMRSQINSIIA